MSFVKKEWKDRIAEYINRRRLTYTDGSTELVEVAREEGTISQEGDAFNAETMNDLEERIAKALTPLDTMEEIEANTQANQLAGALAVKELSEELKKSVSDGKTLVANAITEKRVETATDASFETMAENIGKIVLGSGDATIGDVLAGKTFTNDDGVEYTGTMTNNGAVSKSITPSSSAQSYTIPEGYHNGSGKVNVNAVDTVANQSVYSKNRKYFGTEDDESGSGSTSVSVPTNTTCIIVATVSLHAEKGSAFSSNCGLELTTLSCSGATITTLYEEVQTGMCITRIYKVITGSTATASITANASKYYVKYVDLRLICLK